MVRGGLAAAALAGAYAAVAGTRLYRDGFETRPGTTVDQVQRGMASGTVYLADRIVTARSSDARHLWIADLEAGIEYQGMYVYRGALAPPLGPEIVPGAIVDVAGQVLEFDQSPPGNTLTEINNGEVFFAGMSQVPLTPYVFAPVVELASITDGEPYEGVLVQIFDVKVTAIGGGNRTTVADNTGAQIVLDDDAGNFTPFTVGACYASITGVMHLNTIDDQRRLLPRGAADLVPGANCL